VSSIPGTSLQEMLEVGGRISADVLKLPYVSTIEQQVGRAELGEDTWGPHQTEFHVELKADAAIDEARAQDDLRAILAKYPGIQSEVVTFLGDRISESLTGSTAQIAIKVFGEDLDTLDGIGNQIVTALKAEPGLVDLQFKRQSGTPSIAIQLEPQALAAMGLRTQDALESIQSAFAGETLGQAFNGTRTVDTVLLMPDSLRHRPEQLGKLMIAGPLGEVPLSKLALLTPTADRYSIEHDGGQRRITVTFNVSGRGLQAAVVDAQRRIAGAVALPAGYFIEFTGAAAAENQTRAQLGLYFVLALALILMVLLVAFRWRANSWLVMVNLPFSLIGGVLAIVCTGIGISLGTLVGLVTVFGISARNAILQLAHYEHLVDAEGASWDMQTVLRGANERLIPILMTAAVTALGLAPLALSLSHPGQEIEGPMAVTVLGGLVSSTILNLLVLPALAGRFSRRP
jgi:Cu/Ag efflux pump CusA